MPSRNKSTGVSTRSRVVADDIGPFLKIGTSFSTGRLRWDGKAIASSTAFYMLKARRHKQVGGLVGGLVQAAVSNPDDVRTCQCGDLPQAVRDHLDPKGRSNGEDVIIVQYDSVRRVRVPLLNDAIYVYSGDEKFTIFITLFRNCRIGNFLRRNGWQINTELTPTAVALHGHGFGRSPDTPIQQGPSLWKRILYIILAVAAIIVVASIQSWLKWGHL
jgi:hypothetical protein